MSQPRRCPECGAGLPENAPLGLCPGCLLGAALLGTAEHRPGASGPPAGLPRAASYPEVRESLLRIGLAEPADLEGLDAQAGGDATRLAVALVRAGKLTPYQAGALVQGKSRGLLIGRYLILDKLGEGGMGVVFRARHRGTGRVVALKILPPSFARDGDAVRRFRREFQVASQLDHPNLVAAIEADEDRGVHFLTMDHVVGRDLETLVAEDGPMPVPRALHCGIQIARGLEAAHARGVVHRDVRPGNVMIDAHGNVKVLDLGLARIIEATSDLAREAGASITRTGAYMGSVDFLAPEQADNAKRADHRADAYSLGCTLYFLLAGEPPFPGETLLKRLIAHQDLPAPSLRARRPQVPSGLEAIYLRMMAKDPDGRPGSMTEIIAALEACRCSPREAGDASTDLKTFATTFMKRAAPRRRDRERDPSVFARPRDFQGLRFDPDLNLEDLITDYRPEGGHNTLAEEKLPPRAPRIRSPRPRRRDDAVILSLGAFLLAALALVLFALHSRPGSTPSTPSTPTAIARPEPPEPPPGLRPSPGDSGTGSVAVATPSTGPPAPPSNPLIYRDDFSDPSSGWRIEETPIEGSGTPYRKGYDDGVYFMEAPEAWAGFEAWDVIWRLDAEYEIEAVGRALGPRDAYGGWGLIVAGADGLGFQVSISPGGKLAVYSSPWAEKSDHYFEPFSHPAIKGNGQWNTLTLRVRRRSIEVLVNGESVCEPIGIADDLMPCKPEIAIVKGDASRLRAEFDRIELRFLDRAGTLPIDAAGRVLNLGFEDGTLSDWTAEGDAFDGQPIEGDTVGARRDDSSSGHAGRYWVGTYEWGGDPPTGTLTSVPFRVAEPFASFLVGGGAVDGARVELVREGGPVIATFRGKDGELLEPAVVDLSEHLGREIFLRLVDEASEGWAHLNFDDFRFHPTPPESEPPGLSRSSTPTPSKNR